MWLVWETYEKSMRMYWAWTFFVICGKYETCVKKSWKYWKPCQSRAHSPPLQSMAEAISSGMWIVWEMYEKCMRIITNVGGHDGLGERLHLGNNSYFSTASAWNLDSWPQWDEETTFRVVFLSLFFWFIKNLFSMWNGWKKYEKKKKDFITMWNSCPTHAF